MKNSILLVLSMTVILGALGAEMVTESRDGNDLGLPPNFAPVVALEADEDGHASLEAEDDIYLRLDYRRADRGGYTAAP